MNEYQIKCCQADTLAVEQSGTKECLFLDWNLFLKKLSSGNTLISHSVIYFTWSGHWGGLLSQDSPAGPGWWQFDLFISWLQMISRLTPIAACLWPKKHIIQTCRIPKVHMCWYFTNWKNPPKLLACSSPVITDHLKNDDYHQNHNCCNNLLTRTLRLDESEGRRVVCGSRCGEPDCDGNRYKYKYVGEVYCLCPARKVIIMTFKLSAG